MTASIPPPGFGGIPGAGRVIMLAPGRTFPQTMLVWALSGDLWFGRRELL